MNRNSFVGETERYRRLRNELLQAEVDLSDHVERVAELRRTLPTNVVETDYVFREGPVVLNDDSPSGFHDVRLSQLFTPERDRLIVDHLMFAPADEKPCPMCTMWADSYDAVTPHVLQRANFVLVAKADIRKLRAWARDRGWTNLRLLSSHDNTFNRDFGVESEDGTQSPGLSVFTRTADGKIYHFYSTHARMTDSHWRGIDSLSPVWNLYDLLPEGREEWMPQLAYR